MNANAHNRPGAAIAFVLAGVLAISVNDMLIKQLSGGYPLHEIVFFRAFIGIVFSIGLVQLEGGWTILKTSQSGWHLLRGVLVVISNMAFFLALAALPLADATALFFVAPLFITLLSIPILGERVGIMRLSAVAVGFIGVIIMQRPWADAQSLQASRLVLLLPVIAALTYALNQLMTRKLGVSSKASAMSVYIQGVFLIVSLGFFAIAGDGRFVGPDSSVSVQFLLRAWVWPAQAPFEYIGLPLSVFWGLMIFGDLPLWEVWVGITLILASGLFVFIRERQKTKVTVKSPAKRIG